MLEDLVIETEASTLDPYASTTWPISRSDLPRPPAGSIFWQTNVYVSVTMPTLRRTLRKNEDNLRRQRAARILSRLVGRVYRGHLYGRKPARKLRAQNKATGWGHSEWQVSEEGLRFLAWPGSPGRDAAGGSALVQRSHRLVRWWGLVLCITIMSHQILCISS